REGCRSLVRFLVITARDALAPELQFPLLAGCADRARLRMDDTHLEARRRVDARELPELERFVEVVVERHRIHLGHAVGLVSMPHADLPDARLDEASPAVRVRA